MVDYVVDLVVETGDAGHFLVLKADGHEIDRWSFPTKEEAMHWGEFYADYARKSAAEYRARAARHGE